MVQHYFGSKDEMMIFALQVVGENVAARLAAEEAEEDTAPGAMVRALLVQLLPLDETRRVEGRVALAFFAYSAGRPAVAAALRADSARLREFVAERIGAAQPSGEAEREVDPESAATNLLALVEGLAVHVLGGHYSAETALAVFDDQLRLLFGDRG